MYHLPKGYYYGLINQNRKFEIAWGVQIEDETRKYEICYKIIDAVKNYKDCSEFYWQFISTISEIPARKVKGTIHLPSAVENIEEFRVWAHGPLNGKISKTANDTAVFEVEKLNARTMLEARVVTPKEIFYSNDNTQEVEQLQTILNQEQKWADEANAKREVIAQRTKMIKIILIVAVIVMNIVGVFVAIYLIKKIKKYREVLAQNPKIKPDQELPYFRDIPDEMATPAQAAFLYYFDGYDKMQVQLPRVVSATMLDLCLKQYIEFEIVAGKKDQIKIRLKPEKDVEQLAEDEKVVYNLLNSVPQEDHTFTMKDFQKYCNRNGTKITSKFEAIHKKAKEEQEKKQNYQEGLIKQSKEWGAKAGGYFAWCIATVMFAMWLAVIPSIILTVYATKISARFSRLTQKGMNEREQWLGLRKYMQNFSMMKEKTVPELVLWEKYLVYATTFGIAELVLKQLKVVYPQITDADFMNSHGYAYLYLMYSNSFNHSFINTLNNSVTTTYNNVTYGSSNNYSSGFGGGGGFSSGGGFGGGGGRNGWQITPH